MAKVGLKDLLEAGVHFGHQTAKWNPKMKPYIFIARGGIYILDLQRTLKSLNEACAFLKAISAKGGTVLFVGTKKQAKVAIREMATRVDMPYVTERWLGIVGLQPGRSVAWSGVMSELGMFVGGSVSIMNPRYDSTPSD